MSSIVTHNFSVLDDFTISLETICLEVKSHKISQNNADLDKKLAQEVSLMVHTSMGILYSVQATVL